MAERDVKVRLWASVDQYVRAMDQAKASTKKLEQESGANMRKLGNTMHDAGKKATVGITLPLVGVGAAAVKAAAGFDSSMAKIQALVGLSADEVDGMRDSVLGLANETATAPQELADALFVVTSAGLRGSEAMATLEMAAKASAAGLGQTNDIARAVAGAVNAYGPGMLDAADATDILTATARAGNFETSQLAGALGRVLPFAKQAEASFADVGGAVALLTRTNGNAAESITQIQALMRAFVVPTQEAKTILDSLGTSAEDVRTSIGQNGLVATLETLDDQLGGNREQLGRLLGSSEAASAAFQILDADAQTIADTFGVTADAAGMTNEAFEIVSNTAGFEMKQAWVDLQAAMVQVGDVLLPLVASISGAVGDLASRFSSMPIAAQQMVVGVGAVAAAAGPALMVGGSLLRNYQQISSTWSTMGRGSRLAVGAIGGVGLALTAAAVVYEGYASKKREATQRTEEFTAALEAEAAGQEGALNAQLARNLADLSKEFEALGISAVDAARYIKGENVPAIQALMGATDKYGNSAEGFKMLQRELGVELGGNAADFQKVTSAIGENRSALAGANEIYDATKGTLDGLAAKTSTQSAAQAELNRILELSGSQAASTADDLHGLTDAAEDDAAAQEQLARIMDIAAASAEQQAIKVDSARAAHERYIEAILGSLGTLFSHEEQVLRTDNAYADYTEAVLENVAVQNDAEVSDRDKIRSANDLRLQELALMDQAYSTAEAFAEESGAVEGSKAWSDLMTESLQAQAAKYPELRDEIAQYIAMLDRIPSVKTTNIGITYSGGGNYVSGPGRGGGNAPVIDGNRASGGPTYAGSTYEVLEGGRSELLTENGRTYLMSANDGYVTPFDGGLISANGQGGATYVTNTWDVTVEAPAGSNADEFGRKVWQAIERESRWRGPLIGAP